MAVSKTAPDALRRAQAIMMNNMVKANNIVGVQALNSHWLNGMKGPKGDKGEVGRMGEYAGADPRERYTLSYCGIYFIVELLPSTFDMIEDATNVNGDELAFIKVINEDEWKRIREAWSHKWQQNIAYKAFETGAFDGD